MTTYPEETTRFMTLLTRSKTGITYQPKDVFKFLKDSLDGESFVRLRGRDKAQIFNIPAAFDIETTSFTLPNGDKAACMYEWTLGINGAVMTGRTWDDCEKVFDQIAGYLHTDPAKRRLIIFVRNLSFEFGFICRRFDWDSVFALDNHKPVKAITTTGIEFRCSYILTMEKLSESGEKLTHYDVRKQVGSLDYSLKRGPWTPLDSKEWKYCIYDVLVDMCCIKEKMEYDGDISKLALTRTGYVRIYLRNECFYDGNHKKNTGKYHQYREFISSMEMDVPTYMQSKRGYRGGAVHCNAFNANKILVNVGSWDETSAYPYAECAFDGFPMSTPELYQIKSREDFIRQLRLYACLFDVRFYNLRPATCIDHPLELAKCWSKQNYKVDNGRIISADYIETTLTELDYWTMEEFYTWDKIEVGNFRRSYRGRLPKDLIRAILHLYKIKTELKGVKERVDDYQRGKGDLNASYGDFVMDPVRPTYSFEAGMWIEPEYPDIEKALEDYNTSKKRYNYYLWGIWVCAFNRRELYKAIYAMGTDFAYCDTDSVKALNPEVHMEYFESQNHHRMEMLRRASHELDIPFEMFCPKTIKGIEKPLGMWEYEGAYTRSKFIRSKCYAHEKLEEVSRIRGRKIYKKEFNITCAGVSNRAAVPWMLNKFGYATKAFEAFGNELYIPPEHTGKMTHTYVEDPIDCILTDYLGVSGEIHELTAVNLEPCEYTLSLDYEFIEYLDSLSLPE